MLPKERLTASVEWRDTRRRTRNTVGSRQSRQAGITPRTMYMCLRGEIWFLFWAKVSFMIFKCIDDDGAPILGFESPSPQMFWYSLFVESYDREFWVKCRGIVRSTPNTPPPFIQDSNLVVRELLVAPSRMSTSWKWTHLATFCPLFVHFFAGLVWLPSMLERSFGSVITSLGLL
jgi:hypothetical protein